MSALQGTLTSCVEIGGYHNDFALDAAHGGQQVAYAVVPRCANFGGLMGIDAVTGGESHELVEAATDPFPNASPAWAQVDETHLYWELALGGGEVGDMCAQDPEAFTQFSELPYVVQRIWSNKAALAGKDPCVPALPDEVYFNASPVLSDTIDLSFEGQPLSMQGVKIAVGQSKTIQVDLFSDAKTSGPWTVEAKDFFALMGQPANLGLALDKSDGQNGSKLDLTIDVKSKSEFGVEIFFLISTLGQTTHYWVGLVGD
jgi:hypothetical protein